ncbi:MAG: hypothetical protein ACI85U_002364 [Candidatus Promineifilaceae bacterium]|jgi:hypothetical protein
MINKINGSKKLMGFLLLLVCLGAFLTFATKAQSQSGAEGGRGTTTILETPELVLTDTLVDWTLDSAFVYWADRCAIIGRGPSEGKGPAATYPLKRMPINGGIQQVLDVSGDADCANYQFMATDSSGIYYFNGANSSIEKIPVGSPNGPPVLVASLGNNHASTTFKIKGGNLYFGTILRDIMRVPIAGGTPEFIVKSAGIPNDLEFLGETIYWTDSAGVWSAPVSCNGCSRVQYSTKPGVYLATVSGVGGGVYWVVRGNGTTTADTLYENALVVSGRIPAADSVKFTAPIGYKMGDPIIIRSGFINVQTNFYWTESHGSSQNFVRRNGDLIGTANSLVSPRIFSNNSDIYFATTGTANGAVLRLPQNADALKRDMKVAAIEVTQAIQNLENSVLLIADKATYVRVYGEQESGTIAGGTEAWLEGTRNGEPLPGSPLRAINGIQPLVTGVALDRGPDPSAQGDWLFKLPASWDNQGSIILNAIVDPRQAYEDSNLANNSKPTSLLTFHSQSDPCLFFYPVLTHQPVPTYSDPAFWDSLDRMTTLWPINGLNVYGSGEPIRELELCWDWDGHCWGPYEMAQGSSITNFPSDSDRVLIKLMARQALSRIEGTLSCGLDASIHTVGMVHEDSETGGTGGYANFYINASWVQFKSENPISPEPWNEPRSGAVLAQELTHNFWEYHIGCKPEEDSAFGFASWPYQDRCKLDDRPLTDATTHFGFDPISQQIISPDSAADFMTYNDARWVSDVMYKRVRDDLQALGRAPTRDQDQSLADELIMVSGVYQSLLQNGKLLYTYVLPSDMLSDVHTGEIPADPPADPRGADPEHDHSAHSHSAIAPLGVVRIWGINDTLLAQYDLDLIAPDNHDDPLASYYFLNQFPKPEGEIEKIELVVDGKLVDVIVPSDNSPVVDILSPVVNETLGDTITFRWRGTDADGDVLLFSVIYSPDNGASWIPLVTDYPGDVAGGVESSTTSLTLESPEMLSGSGGNMGRLRVVASDGFNTTFDEVGPFTVPNRPPVAIIQAPSADEVFEPTQPIILRGLGYDAERGLMDEESAEWTVAGKVIGTGRQQTLIGLAPGSHAVSLKVTDSDGKSNTANSVITIVPLSVETVSSLKLDGRCHDTAYVTATPLPLSGYAAGGNASAYLLRRGDDLWVCMSGLAIKTGEVSKADFYLDLDGSGANSAQSDDYLFRLDEGGSPQLFIGNGSGGFIASDSVAFSGQVAATDGAWSAEWKIPASSLPLWNSLFRVAFSHSSESGDEITTWPHAAEQASPKTWAEVAPESVPFIQSVSTSNLTVGDSAVVLQVEGLRFGSEATLLWDGVVQTTEISGTTHLTVSVSSPLLQTAGIIELTVVNTNPTDFPSNSMLLTINNQVPLISALSPSAIESGAAPTTVTITGQKFVAGSVVYWDGEARTTRFINATTLEVDLTSADLSESQAFGLTVYPPEPRQGSSNTAVLVVGDPNQPSKVSSRIYLPLVVR